MVKLIEPQADLPQTHVLIIGVGGYSYLPGGTSAHKNQDDFSNLEQLTSAPYSAIALYDKVMDIHRQNSWIKPLGSIDVLISLPQSLKLELSAYQASGAKLKDIQRAYDEWKIRCSAHPDNVAIFYFCGHGLSNGDDYLLAEDFLASKNRPAECAFSLLKTIRGFYNCPAKQKLFLIDACRQSHTDALMNEFQPSGLDTQRYLGTIVSCFCQQSTAPGAAAFGRPNEVSLYTRALIEALSGQACDHNLGNGWPIGTGLLGLKMNDILLSLHKPGEPVQECTQNGMTVGDIIRYSDPPPVILEVNIDPDALLENTALYCYENRSDNLVHQRDPAPEIWRVTVPAGVYKITGKLNKEPYPEETLEVPARPPMMQPKLRFQMV